MDFGENVRMAFDSLLINRLRAALTTLGIVIGVGAVIGLVSLGRGVQNFVQGEFQSLGSNVLFVFSSAPTSGTRTTIQPLSTTEGEALANPIVAPSIQRVAMEYDVPALVAAGANALQLAVSAVTPNYVDVRTWYPTQGAFFTQDDVDKAARVAVIGTTVVSKLFGDTEFDPVGQTIRINDFVFTVIGVMAEQSGGAGVFGDQNAVVYIPISTGQTRLAHARTRDGGYEVDLLDVQAVNADAMDSASLQIESYLSDEHNILFDGEQDFTIINQADLLSSLGAVTGILTVFLSLIAGISLLVGGIGIMNIMLVSVTERTREIGLRKAVGARAGDIMMQFLVESLILSILGGVIGVALGGLMCVIGGILVPSLKLALTPDAVALATIVSSLIGVFFGLYPASRAARMRPIDALRFE